MKKISVLMLLAFSVLTFSASAQTAPAAKSTTHATAATHKAGAKKHGKKHAKKHKKAVVKK